MPTCSRWDWIARGAEGAGTMDLTIIRSAVTVALFVLFVVLCVYVWSGRRREEFEAAARLPFEETGPADTKGAGEQP